jgi:hypothetical protein
VTTDDIRCKGGAGHLERADNSRAHMRVGVVGRQRTFYIVVPQRRLAGITKQAKGADEITQLVLRPGPRPKWANDSRG